MLPYRIQRHLGYFLRRCLNQTFCFKFNQQTCWLCSSVKPPTNTRALIKGLSSQELENIMNHINTLTAEEMRHIKGISSALAQQICSHREERGNYRSLQDVLTVHRVGMKSLKVLCESLSGENLHYDAIAGTKSVQPFDQVAKIITPTLTVARLQTVKEVTSLDFDRSSVYYSTFDRYLNVIDWGHIPLLQDSICNKPIPSQIVEEAYRVVELLPKSDMFLMESRHVDRRPSPSLVQMFLFIFRLQTAMQTVLNADLPSTQQHCVFHVHESLVLKTFDLRVGRDRVSSQPVVKAMGDDDSDVHIPQSLWRRFYRLNSDVVQENYCNCLLLALSFFKLLENCEIKR